MALEATPKTRLPAKPLSHVVTGAMFLAAVTLGILASAGPGSRLGLWSFQQGFEIMRYAAWIAVAAFALSLFGALKTRPGSATRGLGVALLAMIVSAAVVAYPWWLRRTAQALPPIHDISTDTDNPPLFEAVLPLRANAANAATYGGPEIAEQQHRAYPDVQPIVLNVPRSEAFGRALLAAKDFGWTIVAEDPARGRIEATATTFWYGFQDDIVVRLQPTDAGIRLDARSVSRIGKGDVGANAARIQRYLERVQRGTT